MAYDFHVIFATNDPRSKHLEKELEQNVHSFFSTTFDPVPFIQKYFAALLTYNKDRMVWWNRFQWHPITQKSRRNKLIQAIKDQDIKPDVLVMWGSWFNPLIGTPYNMPFYLYIDQSCNKVADEYDIQSKALERARIRFNADQYHTYKQCAAIFCMSDWARRQTLQSHDIPEEKIMKVGWGPIGLNLMNEEILFNEKEKIVLFVGHQFYRKGVDFLRSAIPMVLKELPNVKFKIVGSNSDRLSVDPHPNLEIIGNVSNTEQMKELYRNATIFVLPHRFDRSPHVLIEAMSAGKPIITSNQGGAVEVVKHGITGFIIDIGDINSLANYIIILLKNSALCKAFGEEGRKLMASEYTWDSVAKKMLGIMNDRKFKSGPLHNIE
jgi:glycosyltransferase involved in cell wall biosynthesis